MNKKNWGEAIGEAWAPVFFPANRSKAEVRIGLAICILALGYILWEIFN